MKNDIYNLFIKNQNFLTKQYSKGEVIFYQGEQIEKSCIIKQGSVKVYTQNEKNETITLFQCSHHDQCPISTLSLLSGNRAVATAQATEDTEVLVLSKESIEDMLENNSIYKEYIFDNIFSVVNMLKELVEETTFMPLKERLVSFLIRQKSDVLLLTHNAISNEIGTNRVVVSRILKELEREKCITLQRGKILLHNLEVPLHS